MSALALHQFLALFSWFITAALLLFIASIARFYGRFSGHKTYFTGYAIPTVLFGVASVRFARQASLKQDDIWVQLLLGVGGVVLCFLLLRLYQLMLVAEPEKLP